MELPLTEEECAICFEPLELGDVAILDCPKRHRYHTKCIGEWMLCKLNKRSTCPLCITEYAEILDVKLSKYGNNWEHLFVSDQHRKGDNLEKRQLNNNTNNTNNRNYNISNTRPNRRASEVDSDCCIPCIII